MNEDVVRMGRPVIGFIGLGRMGLSLAGNLQSKGHTLLVHDMNPVPVKSLVGRGAQAARDIQEIARKCDVVFTMLPGPAQVRAVVLGEHGLVAQARPGLTLVDMSTVDTETVDVVATAARVSGLFFCDAPVGRLAAHADRGESLFMVGADDETLRRLQPFFACMGTTVLHCGGPGAGIRSKLVNNYMVLSYCQLNSEALVLAAALGLDLQSTMQVLTGTTAVNGQLKEKWPAKVLAGDLTPGFDIALGLKDITLACAAAQRAGVALPMGAMVRDMFQLARSGGHDGQDTSAMTDFWAGLNALPPLRLIAGGSTPGANEKRSQS
ncbi:MAG: NAD(P)-dependent oxidoreductase [Polaromonas sp.]|nr:NAD(P)-dependent oxidoreductase [Polaromonas sp.]